MASPATPGSSAARRVAPATRNATSSSFTSRVPTGSGSRSSRSTASAATPARNRRRSRGSAAESGRGRGAGCGRRSPTWPATWSPSMRLERRSAVGPSSTDTPVAVGAGGGLSLRRDARPAALRHRGQGRHGARATHGSPGRRRRRLRQDRGRPAGGLQGHRRRDPGRRPRPDHGPRGSAPGDVPGTAGRLPARRPHAQPLRAAGRAGRHAGRARGRLGRPRRRHPPAALQGHPLPRPRPARGRRGAALRRRPQGAPQAAQDRGRRADALGDAHPANAQHGPRRRPRHERHRDTAGRPPAHPDSRRRGFDRPRPGRHPARDRPRRPGLLRPQPGRDDRGAGGAAPPPSARMHASSSATARWPRVPSSGSCSPSRRASTTSSCARRSSSPASTSRTPTRSSSTAPTRSGSPSSTSCAAGSDAPHGAPTPTSCIGAAASSRTWRASACRPSSMPRNSVLDSRSRSPISRSEGAGNLLGAEQHGNIAAVGFELFTRLLAEAVEERKAELEARPPVIARPTAVIDLPVDAFLPGRLRRRGIPEVGALPPAGAGDDGGLGGGRGDRPAGPLRSGPGARAAAARGRPPPPGGGRRRAELGRPGGRASSSSASARAGRASRRRRRWRRAERAIRCASSLGASPTPRTRSVSGCPAIPTRRGG